MAPRAYWKGMLKLSLVTCPVLLYPAVETAEKTRFHQINRRTGNRLRQQMIDAVTGDVVPREDKARGYEMSRDHNILVEDEELETIQLESTHTIDIESFVPREEIDDRYLDRPYYIAPDGDAGIDAYVVIRDAMRSEDRIAMARVVLTNREHILAIRALGKGLQATTLRYDYEIRDEDDYFADIPAPRISKDMVSLASHIIETKAASFEPDELKDRYETALKELLRRKVAGKPLEKPQRKQSGNVINLMDALRQSLGGATPAKPRKTATRKKAKAARRRAA